MAISNSLPLALLVLVIIAYVHNWIDHQYHMAFFALLLQISDMNVDKSIVIGFTTLAR
jgi:hypothetical protein